MLTSLGPYSLGASIKNLSGLDELSLIEYKVLPKMFPGEVIFTAPPVDFLGHVWKMKIGAIGNRIYKIAAQLFSFEASESEELFSRISLFCEQNMGIPTERLRMESTGDVGHYEMATIWNTAAGNVTLTQGEGAGRSFVLLILTSGDKTMPNGQSSFKPPGKTLSGRIKELWMKLRA